MTMALMLNLLTQENKPVSELLHSKKKFSKLTDFDALMIVLAPTFSGILFFGWLYISLLNFICIISGIVHNN